MTAPTQKDLLDWAIKMFGDVAKNVDERAARLVEEAIEIAQAAGVPLVTLDKIAKRVYSRPPGEMGQEIGGCAFTLATMAENTGFSVSAELQREWERVHSLPPEHWRKKHADKVAAGTADIRSTPQHASWCSIHGAFDPAIHRHNVPTFGKCNCKNSEIYGHDPREGGT